jgi:8-oxo-dGTP diphosphatase
MLEPGAPNPFESGTRRAIPSVLVYVRAEGHVLMIHKGGRPGDFHDGKWNGLGGKCDVDESPLETAIREVREESGLELKAEQLIPMGALTFPNFKPRKAEDWIVFVFMADLPARLTVPARTAEGSLHWVVEEKLLELNLWPGDREYLPHFMARKPLVGTVWYVHGEFQRAWIAQLGGGE